MKRLLDRSAASGAGRDRRGMILPLVLLIAGMLLVTGLAVWRTNQTDLKQISINVRRVQAQYLAKGALQLALLKGHLLPTPFYDAAAYSVGKNPYYVHSYLYQGTLPYGQLNNQNPPGPAANLVPGPAFLTGNVQVKNGNIVRTSVKDIPGLAGSNVQGDDINHEDHLPAGDYVADRYLNYFALDLADAGVTPYQMNQLPGGQVSGQPAISISTTTVCPILGKTDPYWGTFRILSLSVQGALNNKQYGVETVHIVATATINSKISGEQKYWTEREESFYKVRRLDQTGRTY